MRIDPSTKKEKILPLKKNSFCPKAYVLDPRDSPFYQKRKSSSSEEEFFFPKAYVLDPRDSNNMTAIPSIEADGSQPFWRRRPREGTGWNLMDPGSSLNRLRGTLQKAEGPSPFWMPREAWEVEGGPGVLGSQRNLKRGQKDPI